jgi:uncharacterized protein YjbJ (UPF0337 family)
MGSTADKAAGVTNEVIGKAKQGIGSVVGSERLQAEAPPKKSRAKPKRPLATLRTRSRNRPIQSPRPSIKISESIGFLIQQAA